MVSQINFFRDFGPQFGPKIKGGGGGSPAPPGPSPGSATVVAGSCKMESEKFSGT